MATKLKLSKVTHIALRDCWDYEDRDFTPWLAKEENIALLADALGLPELEVKAKEEHVGPFRADILCAIPGTDKLVLIENQLEKTDHSHLGQIMTYAAGLDTVTIIWIAEKFTEEHRAAIDWFNRITDKEFNFFGIEIELIKIGDSQTAPIFNIIAKPNDWTKNTSQQISQSGKSETENLRYEFWNIFRDFMTNNPSKLFKPQSASYNHWMNIAIGRSHFNIALILNTQDKKVGLQLYLEDDADKKYFDSLFEDKDAAERSIGEKLEWRRLDGKKASTIDFYRSGDFTNKDEQLELCGWLKDYTERYIKYFKPIIKKL